MYVAYVQFVAIVIVSAHILIVEARIFACVQSVWECQLKYLSTLECTHTPL